MSTGPAARAAAGETDAGSTAWMRKDLCEGGGRALGPAQKETPRVIAHIDMDAFYAQIEQDRDVALKGRPVAVVQYNTTNHDIEDMRPDDNRIVEESASSIIAVSYEARPFGVKRNMKAGDALKLCPELSLVQVPTRNGKADISLYRRAGEKVVSVLERAGGELTTVEKASIDEVYVEVTRAAQALLSSLKECGAVANERQQNQQQQQQRRRRRRQSTEGEEGCAERDSAAPPAVSEEDVNGGGKGGTMECRRWEEIGEGGWAAVVSETVTTHVAGLSDGDPTKEQRLADGVSWWARPKEAFTQDELLLGCGAAVVSRLRAAVRAELNYSCTAGVAHNKLLAKLCSNMHKPNAQTVLPLDKVHEVFHTLPVERVRGWGGKLGVKIMEKFGVSTAGEVAAVGAVELQRVLGDEEGWRAWEKSNGVDRDPVKARSAPKSIGCSKTFPGKATLTSFPDIERWLSELSKELILRLTEHRQTGGQSPTKLTVSFAEILQKKRPKAVSRCCRMVNSEIPAVVEACMKMVRASMSGAPKLSMLGVSTSGFADSQKGTMSIQSFFGAGTDDRTGKGGSSGGGDGGSRASGLGFLPGAVIGRREAGVKRPRPESGATEGEWAQEVMEDGADEAEVYEGHVEEGADIAESDDEVSFCGIVSVDGEGSGGCRPRYDADFYDLQGQGAAEPPGRLGAADGGARSIGGGRLEAAKAGSVHISAGDGARGVEGETRSVLAESPVEVVDSPSRAVYGGGGSGDADARDKQRRALFGRGGASGVFGEVDPGVLAELPPEIQREIWMQQGGRGTGPVQLRLSEGGKLSPSKGGLAGSGRGRRAGRGGRRRGSRGVSAQSRRGTASISSFFGGK